MIVKFKDGKEIEFKRFGDIWLADSVIWEKTKHHGTFDELHALKAEINAWFEENAPEEIRDKFVARLPLQAEIEPLSFKDQIAYSEGKTDHVADYFLGDETDKYPISCSIDVRDDVFFIRFFCFTSHDRSVTDAVRLCLEERVMRPKFDMSGSEKLKSSTLIPDKILEKRLSKDVNAQEDVK